MCISKFHNFAYFTHEKQLLKFFIYIGKGKMKIIIIIIIIIMIFNYIYIMKVGQHPNLFWCKK